MAFVGVSWVGLFLVFTAAPYLVSSQNLTESASSELEKMLVFPQRDSKITKRVLPGRVSNLSLQLFREITWLHSLKSFNLVSVNYQLPVKYCWFESAFQHFVALIYHCARVFHSAYFNRKLTVKIIFCSFSAEYVDSFYSGWYLNSVCLAKVTAGVHLDYHIWLFHLAYMYCWLKDTIPNFCLAD